MIRNRLNDQLHMMSFTEIMEESLRATEAGHSRLTEDEFYLRGMSGRKGRMLLNNICSYPGIRYLEIGCWRGSTLCCALKGNSVEAVAVDNFSEFAEPFKHPIFKESPSEERQTSRGEFYCNLAKYDNGHVTVLEGDCFDPAIIAQMGVSNLYFYDAGHSPEEHERAFTEMGPALAREFIAIVDDYGWEFVRSGTCQGIEKAGYKILFDIELGMDAEEDPDGWWRGWRVLVLQKP